MTDTVSGLSIAPPLVDPRGWADARTAPSWRPQDGSAYRLHTYDPYDVIEIWIRIDGTVRTGVLYEHADWGERPARRLIRPFFAPVLGSGERDRWVWWQPDRMRLTIRSDTSTLEAGEPHEGDAIRCKTFQWPGRRLVTEHMWQPDRPVRGEIRLGGAWRTAQIITRSRWSDGTETCLAWVYLPEPEWGAHVRYVREYLWDPRTTHLITARP